MGPGAGTQCDAGRWSEGKSGRGKREKTKKESGARGESASLGQGKNEETKDHHRSSSHESLNPLFLVNNQRLPGPVSSQWQPFPPISHVTGTFASSLVTHTPTSRLPLESLPCRGPGRMHSTLKTSTLFSSQRSLMPVSMLWAGEGSIRVNQSSFVSCSGHQLRPHLLQRERQDTSFPHILFLPLNLLSLQPQTSCTT